ncbi:MAG: glycosyltransferase, partial [Thermodesulfobacteriota bacterium]
ELPFIQQLTKLTDITFLIAGQQENRQLADNVILLARDSGIYHPDLISGSDLVVCKSGYSTVAECMQAGVPVVTVGRATFPESAVLEEFCASHLDGQVLEQETFLSGRWLQDLDDLLSRQRKPPLTTNGADRVAEILIPRLSPAHG